MIARVGLYKIIGLIGGGDITTVYRAFDPLRNREVALKVMRRESNVPDARQYIDNEAHMLRILSHPRIPTFYEYHTEGLPYIACELVRGKDLQAMFDAGGQRMVTSDIVRWSIAICEALSYLHDQAIAFRDLKPAHIMIDTNGNVRLVDFNLAKQLPPEKILKDTDRIGTAGFASPEQHEGTITPLVDIYALGATMHYLLTRRDPRLDELFTFHDFPPSLLNSTVTTQLEAVILKAVEPDPSKRYQSADDLKTALAACLIG